MLAQNKSKVLVLSPAFVSDCLETIASKSMKATKKILLESGGDRA